VQVLPAGTARMVSVVVQDRLAEVVEAPQALGVDV
jgi:hypothetical protein